MKYPTAYIVAVFTFPLNSFLISRPHWNMMFRSLSLVLLSTLSFPYIVAANSGCVAFDIYWNLLAFGFNGKDYNAGTQDTWTSGMLCELEIDKKR